MRLAHLLLAVSTLSTAAISAPAMAQVSYLKCDMQVTFEKPGFGGTEWVHREGRYDKYFRLDDSAKMVEVFNARGNVFVPICNPSNNSCQSVWSNGEISLDATKGPDHPSPHLDFRRAFSFDRTSHEGHLLIADYGDSHNGKPNMSWSFEGKCAPSEAAAAKPMPYPPGPISPKFVDALAFPVSNAERDRVLASRNGNTVTGLSGGSRWFHMWMFGKGVGYTGDDDDITAEGALRQWYVGKEASGGYRLCEAPVPAKGVRGCYPLNVPKMGDSWIEHDVYGDAQFQLLPGRQ
jgi:hypothetical protein